LKEKDFPFSFNEAIWYSRDSNYSGFLKIIFAFTYVCIHCLGLPVCISYNSCSCVTNSLRNLSGVHLVFVSPFYSWLGWLGSMSLLSSSWDECLPKDYFLVLFFSIVNSRI
jgi:hypothetical protein